MPRVRTLGKRKKRDSNSVMRGGRYVLIQDRVVIDTSALHGGGIESKVELERYNDQWLLSHPYEARGLGASTASSSFGGSIDTAGSLNYLKTLKDTIAKQKEQLSQLEGDLSSAIGRLS